MYRSYGLHWCLNLTCGPADLGAAVLIRAVEPRAGLATMRRRRGGAPDHRLADGPGKLAQALAISGAVDGLRNEGGAPLRLEEHALEARGRSVLVTPRIGISRAGDWPLRFVLRSRR